SVVSPQAVVLTPKNFSQIFSTNKPIIIDVWHPDFVTCRLHSPLFSDLFPNLKSLDIYKLDAKTYPKLAKKIGISTFPSLLIYQKGRLIHQIESYIEPETAPKVNQQIKKLLIKSQ
ncbi:hypothetical protein A3K55_01065, partial [Candidatus Shapirobacteria bacterium RBG_13_44_7]